MRFKSFCEILLIIILISACSGNKGTNSVESNAGIIIVPGKADSLQNIPSELDSGFRKIVVDRDVPVSEYFLFMDSVAVLSDSLRYDPWREHIMVHANSWIIDTLVSFDYYRKKAMGEFVYDQKRSVVLHSGDTLVIPGVNGIRKIRTYLLKVLIDVNIPEYKLRIWIGDSVEYTFPVRVGRNEMKFLKTAGRIVDLRTPVGSGEIVRVENDPWYINPANGHHYLTTKRDDGEITLLPRIPFLEPAISGERQGALIHPTTNPNTLGKSYSNGCVGTAEGDAWIIYYHAPLGTKVNFRYDLRVTDEYGNPEVLSDIYNIQGIQ